MKTIAKALVQDNSGHILVLYRSATHPRYAHHPDFPGGEVETNESAATAIVREIAEETALDLGTDSLRLLYTKNVSAATVHQLFLLQLDHSQPDIVLSYEHERYHWIPIEQLIAQALPSGVDDYYQGVMEHIRAHGV